MFDKCLSCSNWYCLSRRLKVGTCVLIGRNLCKLNTFKNPHLFKVRLRKLGSDYWQLVWSVDYWIFDSVVIKPLLDMLKGLSSKQLKE